MTSSSEPVAPARSRLRGKAVAVALLAAGALVVAAGTAIQPARSSTLAQVLPDLRMARPAGFRITTSSSGRKHLRFTTTIGNMGPGRFELLASRASRSIATMTVRQRIWRTDGTTRLVLTRATARYAGDGHNHWHIRRVATYELIDAHGARIRRDRKIGFCFFDTNVFDRRAPGYRPVRRYVERWCGVRAGLTARMGISPGWGDTYGSTLAYQWIDVTGLPTGTYWLVATADKENLYRERNERNNCSWAMIRLSRRASAVTVLSRGSGCTPPGVGPSPTPSPSPSASPRPSSGPSPSASAAAM